MAVHYVQVQPVGTRPIHAPSFFAKRGEIGGEQRRRNNHRHTLANQLQIPSSKLQNREVRESHSWRPILNFSFQVSSFSFSPAPGNPLGNFWLFPKQK